MNNHLLLNVQSQRGLTILADNELAVFLAVIIAICLVAFTAAAIAKL